MDFRYVYRRIEDAIGTPLSVRDAPHVSITRALRRDFRELRDVARVSEHQAICLASLAGNAKLDAVKISGRVFDLLDEANAAIMPYIMKSRKSETAQSGSSEYEEAFAELEKFKKQLEQSKSNKPKTESKVQDPLSAQQVT